jgi:hypothetical protein
MKSAFETLRVLLRQRLSIIADKQLREADPAAQLEGLRKASEAIDAWRTEYQAACPPKLRHYLEQSSLQKALDFIEQELQFPTGS